MGTNNRRPLYTEQELAEQRQKAAAAAATPESRASAPAQASTCGSASAQSTRAPTTIAMSPPGTLQPQQQLQMLDPSQLSGIQPYASQPNGAQQQQQQPLLITDFEQPCTLKGLGSAFYAGLLGYFFGVVPAVVKHRARMWGLVHQAGTKSATQLALMSGLYTAVHCIAARVRQKDDGWSRGIAGCSTGLVLGWGGGPASAAQSCVAIGAISCILDFGGGTAAPQAAHAAALAGAAETSGTVIDDTGLGGAVGSQPHAAREWRQLQPQHYHQQLPQPLEQVLGAVLGLPPLVWLGHCCQMQQGQHTMETGINACPLSIEVQSAASNGRR